MHITATVLHVDLDLATSYCSNDTWKQLTNSKAQFWSCTAVPSNLSSFLSFPPLLHASFFLCRSYLPSSDHRVTWHRFSFWMCSLGDQSTALTTVYAYVCVCVCVPLKLREKKKRKRGTEFLKWEECCILHRQPRSTFLTLSGCEILILSDWLWNYPNTS